MSINKKSIWFYTGSFQPVVCGINPGSLVYAVVFDAGSTGTRVLAYEFMSYPDGRLILKRQELNKTKPGLSSYHADPQEGAKSIRGLLKTAKKFVPKGLHEKTPLVLKATAGLRLLKRNESIDLLKAVHREFKSSKFLVKDNSVEVMSGTDEGIYSWFAVNILTSTVYFIHSGKTSYSLIVPN